MISGLLECPKFWHERIPSSTTGIWKSLGCLNGAYYLNSFSVSSLVKWGYSYLSKRVFVEIKWDNASHILDMCLIVTNIVIYILIVIVIAIFLFVRGKRRTNRPLTWWRICFPSKYSWRITELMLKEKALLSLLKRVSWRGSARETQNEM